MLRNFGEDYIVVAVGDDADDFNKLITLNSVGAFVYQQMETETTYEEICNKMLDKYDIDRTTAENDVKAFLSDVKNAGLLDE